MIQNYGNTYLIHHGVKGQKWGVRKQRTKSVFVSGSSKATGKIDKGTRKEIDHLIKKKSNIIVGDAPGIDSQVQDYLAKKKYKNVTVYGTNSLRKNADTNSSLGWKKKIVKNTKDKEGTPEYNRTKDIVMSKDADEAIGVVLPDGGAKATRNNLRRMMDMNKPVTALELRKTPILKRMKAKKIKWE